MYVWTFSLTLYHEFKLLEAMKLLYESRKPQVQKVLFDASPSTDEERNSSEHLKRHVKLLDEAG